MKVLIICVTLAAVSTASAFDLYPLIRPQFASGDVISGEDAEPTEVPYIVSMKSTGIYGSSHFCAGSIIDQHWVLTAAHCLVYDNFDLVAGLYERNDESQSQKRTVSLKEGTIQHEKYGGGVGPYDIGLIYVDPKFDFSEIRRGTDKPLVGKVNLPSGKFSKTGDGILFGWGYDENCTVPNKLQKLHTTIISYDQCKNELPPTAPLVKESNTCTHNPGTIASACNGDSGGPLVKKNTDKNNTLEQMGIVSWGYTPCITTKYPSVYTDTSAYVAWIGEQQKNYVPVNKQ